MISITIDGIDDALRHMRQSKANIERGTPIWTRIIAEQMLEDARRLAPYRTGLLRSSIQIQYAGDGMSAKVFTELYYAVYQEFGTRHHRAQPFLRPAFEINRARAERLFKSMIQEAVL